MNVSDIKQLKERDGMTNEQISELTGISLFVVDGIFSGEIEEPKYMTPLEFEELLTRLGVPFYCDETPIWDTYKEIVAKHDERGAEAVGNIELVILFAYFSKV